MTANTNNAAATMLGNCAYCGKQFVVEGGTLVRHGWSEAGGRRAGYYGNTYQVGGCYGTGTVPVQISAAGLADVIASIAKHREALIAVAPMTRRDAAEVVSMGVELADRGERLAQWTPTALTPRAEVERAEREAAHEAARERAEAAAAKQGAAEVKRTAAASRAQARVDIVAAMYTDLLAEGQKVTMKDVRKATRDAGLGSITEGQEIDARRQANRILKGRGLELAATWKAADVEQAMAGVNPAHRADMFNARMGLASCSKCQGVEAVKLIDWRSAGADVGAPRVA